MKDYRLSDEAKADLVQIQTYLMDNAGVEIAERVLDDLESAMEKIAIEPLIGHKRDDLTNRPVRFWRVHSYLVIYTPDVSPLAIVRVLHASRDATEQLGDS